MSLPKKIPLSGSSHGRAIPIATTALTTSATVIHTAFASTSDGAGDEIVLYAANNSTAGRSLTLGLGGLTDPDDLLNFSLESNSYSAVLPGVFLRNSLVIRGSINSTAGDVSVSGYVLRSTA